MDRARYLLLILLSSRHEGLIILILDVACVLRALSSHGFCLGDHNGIFLSPQLPVWPILTLLTISSRHPHLCRAQNSPAPSHSLIIRDKTISTFFKI